MNRLPTQNWFQPTQSLEGILPVLALLSVALLFVFALAGITYLWQLQRARRMEWKRFEINANRFRLSQRENALLRRIAALGSIQPAYKIFTDQSRFESAVESLKSANHYLPQRVIESIRHKLYNLTETKARVACNTQGLIPGRMLSIRNLSQRGKSFKGKLLDNELMGLLVAITSPLSHRIAIHPKNRLAVTAELGDGITAYFHTTVSSVLPGPRKMVMFKHADFISLRPHDKAAPREPNPLLQPPRAQIFMAKSKAASFSRIKTND